MAEPEENKYAIHEAAREGRLQQVENLLNTNPRLARLEDLDARLPIHWATTQNHLPIITLLASQRGFDADAADAAGWTPLMIAASLPQSAGLPAATLLLAKEASPGAASTTGATALHFAASKGNLDVVRALLAAGASARVKDRRGQLPLHRAAAAGSLPVVRVLLDGKLGRSPANAADVDGLTPLHHAVSEGNGDVAVELLKAGAEPDRKDGDGRTAVECAPDKRVRDYLVRAAEREGIDL